MANGIDIDDVVTELGDYFRKENRVVREMTYAMPQLDPYLRPVTKVKGEFPAIHSVTDHVIQQFVAEWNELGTTKFVPNILKSYHQKVNFPIVPATVLGTYLAEHYDETKDIQDMPVSKYIVEKELKPKVEEDLAWLHMNGAYDAAKPSEFGFSMDGMVKILENGIADGSMYKIPMDTLTDSNMVEQVTKFEKSIPAKARRKVKAVFMSTENLDRYADDYEATYGANMDYVPGKKFRSKRRGYEIVGLDYLDGTDIMWATPEGNFLKLIDVFNKPTVTDVQKQDYKVKIFMEFHLGLGFWTNQLVYVSDYSGSFQGLGSSEGDGNNLYYA